MPGGSWPAALALPLLLARRDELQAVPLGSFSSDKSFMEPTPLPDMAAYVDRLQETGTLRVARLADVDEGVELGSETGQLFLADVGRVLSDPATALVWG